MKKFILSIILALTLFATPASAEFFPDVIVTSPNGIWTDSRAYTTLNDAIDAVGSNERTIKIVSPQTVTALTVPSNVTLDFERDGAIVNSGQLTINTRNIRSPDRQIFTGAGDVDFADGSVVRSAWFPTLYNAIDLTNDDSVTLLVTSQAHITATCALGNDVTLKWDSPNNIIQVDSGVVFSNIKNIEAGNYQIFAGLGYYDFLDGTELKLNWFHSLQSVLAQVEDEEVTIIVNEYSVIQADVTAAANEGIKVVKGGRLNIDTGVTLTINGSFSAGIYQVFSGDGAVVFPEGVVAGYAGWANKRRIQVDPHWWGVTHDGDAAATTTALQKAIDSGGDIYCPIPGEKYNTNDTIVLADVNYDMNYCAIVYDGVGTAVSIAKLYGNEIRRMYIQKLDSYIDGDGSIGFLSRYMYRVRVDVHTYRFETGIALKPNVGGEGFSYCDFRFEGENTAYALDVDVTGYTMTTCKFYDFESGGSYTYVGSIGARFIGAVLNTVFYNPIVENVKTGFYLEGTGKGFTVYNGYGELVDKHFDLGTGVTELTLHGGTWRGGGASVGTSRPVLPENVADKDTKIYTMNMPVYPSYGNDVVFWDEGAYRGKNQKFTNLVEGGDFEHWQMREYDAGNKFTSGGVYEVVAGDILTGSTSTATARVEKITLYGGSWAGGDADGTLVLENQTGTFQNEDCDVGANNNVLTLPAGDSVAYLGRPNGTWGATTSLTGATRSSTQKHSGDYSLRLLNDTGATKEIYYNLPQSGADLTKFLGQSFTASLWVHCSVVGQIRLQGSAAAPSGNTSDVGLTNTTIDEWELIHVTVRVPSDATSFSLSLIMFDVGGATDYIYIDDFMATIGDNVPGFNGRYYNDSDNILDYQDRLAAAANVATTVTKVNALLDDLKAKGLMKYKE